MVSVDSARFYFFFMILTFLPSEFVNLAIFELPSDDTSQLNSELFDKV